MLGLIKKEMGFDTVLLTCYARVALSGEILGEKYADYVERGGAIFVEDWVRLK